MAACTSRQGRPAQIGVVSCVRMSDKGHQRKSASAATMSLSYAEAVMREAKTDIAAQKSAFEGRADLTSAAATSVCSQNATNKEGRQRC